MVDCLLRYGDASICHHKPSLELKMVHRSSSLGVCRTIIARKLNLVYQSLHISYTEVYLVPKVWNFVYWSLHIHASNEYSRNPHKRTYIFRQQPVKGCYLLPFTIHILGMGSVSLIKTCKNCICIPVACSPIIYFTS